jgi:hypothetical protein
VRTDLSKQKSSTALLQYGPNYYVTPDGWRFLMMKPEQESEPTEFRIVLNWLEDPKRLVPAN